MSSGFANIPKTAPFSEEDVALLNRVVGPANAVQRAWLAGFGVKCVTDAGVGHLSRPAFPYTVRFDDVEFNQLMSIRTVFEAQTSTLLESFFDPLPDGVA